MSSSVDSSVDVPEPRVSEVGRVATEGAAVAPYGGVDLAKLLRLRAQLRRLVRWTENQARAAGLTPALHQLLVVVAGSGDPRGPTLGEVAATLQLRPHSVVELAGRAEKQGLLERVADEDERRVRLRLAPPAVARLAALAAAHQAEIDRLSEMFGDV